MKRKKSVVTNFSLLFIKACIIGAFAASSLVFASDSSNIRYYLQQIINAKNTQQYSGVFVYERPAYKNEVYVHQQVNQQGEVLHWVKENTSNEGFLKTNGKITCTTKNYNNQFRINTILQLIDEQKIETLLQNYDAMLVDKVLEIAGVQAYELIFRGKNNDRHTYKLAFDKKNFVPLQFIFLDDKQTILEQGTFLTFRYLTDNDRIKPLDNCLKIAPKPKNNEPINWLVGWVPKGFISVHNVSEKINHEQLMYSDGIVSFSVFIEPLVNSTFANIEKHSGATTLVFHKVEDIKKSPYLVVVVGEIPSSTAVRIASSIQYNKM